MVEKIALKFMYDHCMRDSNTIVDPEEEARTQMHRPGDEDSLDRETLDSQEARYPFNQVDCNDHGFKEEEERRIRE